GTKGSRLTTSEATRGFVLDERRLVGVVRGPRAVEALLPGIRMPRFVRGWKHANVPRRLPLGACVVVLAPVPPTARCGRTAVDVCLRSGRQFRLIRIGLRIRLGLGLGCHILLLGGNADD